MNNFLSLFYIFYFHILMLDIILTYVGYINIFRKMILRIKINKKIYI